MPGEGVLKVAACFSEKWEESLGMKEWKIKRWMKVDGGQEGWNG